MTPRTWFVVVRKAGSLSIPLSDYKLSHWISNEHSYSLSDRIPKISSAFRSGTNNALDATAADTSEVNATTEGTSKLDATT